MTSRKLSFFEFWRSKKERDALLERANHLRLLPSQLRQLHGDSGVRAALQNGGLASLLPPCGTEVFRRFSPASLAEIQHPREAEDKKEVAEKDKPSRDLEAGKPLPFIYGDPPPELLNTPLEELDPHYQSQKTFIVIDKGNVIHRFNAESACFLLSPLNPLRVVATKILLHSLFQFFILATILTNCVFMTLSQPPAWRHTVEFVFVAIYTFEFIVKIVSRGFCIGKFTFLRDPWSWLDVMVVITAYLEFFVSFSVLSTIPRVLKIITVISGLKATVAALVRSLRRLAGVTVLMVFCLSILALIGLQFFMGNLRQKCMRVLHNNITFSGSDETGIDDFDFTAYISNPMNWYYRPFDHDALVCGNSSGAGVCPDGYICLRGERNPNYGYTNFDSFGWSLLSQFRLMTGDYWENLMHLTLRATGKFHLMSFVVIFLPVCFCLLSLFVAVVAMAAVEPEQVRVAEAERKEEEFHRILEALKKRERQEQAASETEDGEDKKSEEQNLIEEPEKDERSCFFAVANRFPKWNCCGCCPWLQQRLLAVVTSPFFDLVIVICLIINTIFMAMTCYPMTSDFDEHLMIANLVFTMIFTAEMVVKLVAMGPRRYFQVGWNIFDCVIVIWGLVEIFTEIYLYPLSFQVMRVLRLARWWWSFQLVLKTMWISVRALRNLTLLLLIMVFLFSAAGMQMFGKDYNDCVCKIAEDCLLPRWHMNDFYHSFLVIARVLCGEWIESLWDCMEVSGQTRCLIFFMVVVIIGNVLVLNLFLTLLMSSFSYECVEAPDSKEKHKAISRLHAAVASINTWTVEHLCPLLGKNKNHVDPDHAGRKEYLALNLASDLLASEEGDHGNLTGKPRRAESPRAPIADIEIEFKMPEIEEEKEKKCDDVQKHPEVQPDKDDDDPKGNTPEDCCSNECCSCCPFQDIDTSRGVGKVWFNFRRTCFTIVRHPCFEAFMVVVIIMSSVALVFEDMHLPNRKVLRGVLEKADQVFTFVFLLEMLLKWIGLGLRRYFTDAWCWFDFLVLDVSLAFLVAGRFGFTDLSVLQSLRALMPLRAVSRFQGMRVVVHTVARAVPAMVNMLLVFQVVWLIFSIYGVNLFAGKFYFCFNETSQTTYSASAVANKSECMMLIMENYTEITWQNVRLNFDSVAAGYLSLLHVATLSDWIEPMYSAVDATLVDSQPAYESQPSMYLYFICFFVVSSFFTLNLFIRAIVDRMQRDKSEGKHIFMTEKQERYFRALKTRFSQEPQTSAPRPQSRCLAWLFDLVTRPCFEVVMVTVICLNMLVLMIETFDDSILKFEVLHFINFSFFIIFFIEAIVKIMALRKHYFCNCLNIIDIIVIIMSIVGVFLEDFLIIYFFSPAAFSMLRLARISRVLHLVPFTRSTRKLLLVFMMSLPAIFNISLLLFLTVFSLSIFGMFNFAFVRRGGAINDIVNFETFGNSLISVVSGVFSPNANTPPYCDPNLENPGTAVTGDCGTHVTTVIFTVLSVVFIFLLLLHLFIAVLLEVFSSGDARPLSDRHLQMFYDTWRQFDPESSQFIQYSKLSDFCNTLQDPLRIPKPNTNRLVHMDLPLLPGDKIHYSDVLRALAAQVSADQDVDALRRRIEEKFTAKPPGEPISSSLRQQQQQQQEAAAAAAVIQRAFRRRRGAEEARGASA